MARRNERPKAVAPSISSPVPERSTRGYALDISRLRPRASHVAGHAVGVVAPGPRELAVRRRRPDPRQRPLVHVPELSERSALLRGATADLEAPVRLDPRL